ncbi:S1 family peptidase [Nocardioides coralli]|uniref:S1 family peptidase n=1 Tax=Nocardioides coralli TaxID=2872154 RepID=UPI001CA3B9B5|nr:serine protease [Nocardioides coralli]QZY29968.1 serine protease [Nocardioides coralli]
MRSLARTATRLLAAAVLLAGGSLAASPATAIVGGSHAEEGEFPFMASIQDKGRDGTDGHFCGGSVIGSRWVLTAAHCLVDTKPHQIQVGVGRADIDDLSAGQTLSVDRIIVHPDYETTDTYDAALVRVTQDIASPSIALTDVGEDSLEAHGARLTVAGWGTEFFGSPFIPARLKSVDVEAVADQQCRTNAAMGFRPESEICAETLGGDSCQGDSGGPLFGTVAGRVTQVGIVSYGLGCATPQFPGVYGEVNNPSIRGFITQHTGI